jgi:fimbrial chaperone protein
MPRSRVTAWTFGLAAWFGAVAPAWPGELRLEPVSLVLPAGERSTLLWLSNTGGQPLRAQVRLYAWNQEGGGEVLTATDQLAASPPLLEVPPQGRQLVRLVRLGTDPPVTETAYRLIVDELPSATPPPAADAPLLRYSIPLFALPATGTEPTPARLRARIGRDAEGRRLLRLYNDGGRHARIAQLAFVGSGGRQVLAPGLARYVLPGRYKEWRLRPPARWRAAASKPRWMARRPYWFPGRQGADRLPAPAGPGRCRPCRTPTTATGSRLMCPGTGRQLRQP